MNSVVSPELCGLLKETAPESNINEGHNDAHRCLLATTV